MSTQTIYAYRNAAHKQAVIWGTQVQFTGAWSNSTTYLASAFKAVTYGGVDYLAIADTTGEAPNASASWSQLVVVEVITSADSGTGSQDAEALANSAIQTANAAFSIAVAGTNTANRALSLATTGTNTANAAFSIAVAGTNTANAALSLAATGTNHATALYVQVGTINNALAGKISSAGGEMTGELVVQSVRETAIAINPDINGELLLDFAIQSIQTVTVDRDITVATGNQQTGRGILVVMTSDNNGDHGITCPGFVFFSPDGAPTVLPSGKTGLLALKAIGSDQNNQVLATWTLNT